MNRVILIGRLTRDPELRTTQTGKSVVEFSIAVDKRMKGTDGQDADFFRIKAWNNQAEFAANYLSKGRLVAVDGRLEQRKWQAQDGTNRETIEVVADSLQGLDRPRQDGAGGEAGGRPAAAVVNGGSAPTEEEYDPFAHD